MNYQYPLEETWTTEEVVDVIAFFSLVEKAYETNVGREELLHAYQTFKKVVPSKGEERLYFADFEKSSSYSSYHVVKKAQESKQSTITMKRPNS